MTIQTSHSSTTTTLSQSTGKAKGTAPLFLVPPAGKPPGARNPEQRTRAPYYGSVAFVVVMLSLYTYLRLFDPRPNIRQGQEWTFGLFVGLAFLLIESLRRVHGECPGVVDPVKWGRDVDQSSNICHERKRNGARRFCRKTQVWKPDRAHYCHVTDRCILRFDHYCIFVDASVGHRNHKYFLLFLLYVSLCAGFICIDTVMNGRVIEQASTRTAATLPPSERVSSVFSLLMFIAFVLSAAFSLSLLVFLVFHLYLVGSGYTTLEQTEKKGRYNHNLGKFYDSNTYDGGIINNFKQVMGNNYYAWLLPVPPQGLGDGTSWVMGVNKRGMYDPIYTAVQPGVCY